MGEADILGFEENKGAVRMAGFWIRVAANLIDVIVIVAVGIPLMSLLFKLVASANINLEDISDNAKVSVVFLYLFGLPLLCILYPAIFEGSKLQGSPGKMTVRIKVTDSHGNRISFLRALARNTSKILSALILYIGFLMPIWTQYKQALHDIIVETYVVYK